MSKRLSRLRGQMRRVIKSSWLPTFLGLFALLAAALATISLTDIGLAPVVQPYRPLLYDLSVGYLVSYIFYLLVVVIPDQLRRRRTRRWLRYHYDMFKLSCIEIYLSAIGEPWDSELPSTLLAPEIFSDYFSARFSPDQMRWHAVHNGLYEYGLPQLVVECELLAREIEFSLIKLDLQDDDIALFLKRFSRTLTRLKTSSPSYDDIKRLLSVLYPLHSHWSWIDGDRGRDPVGEMIARI